MSKSVFLNFQEKMLTNSISQKPKTLVASHHINIFNICKFFVFNGLDCHFGSEMFHIKISNVFFSIKNLGRNFAFFIVLHINLYFGHFRSLFRSCKSL